MENPVALSFIFQDELYLLNSERSRYAESSEPVVVTEAPAPVFNHLGKNNAEFLILVNYQEHEFIQDVHLAALENILKRKGLDVDDAAIVNLHRHQSIDFEALTLYFSPKKIVMMGSGAIPSGINSPVLNKPEQIDGRQILYSYSFDDMMDSNERKKLFWEQMKTL